MTGRQMRAVFLWLYFGVMFSLALVLVRQAWPADALTCDPQEGVTTYQVEENGVEQPPVAALPGGVLDFDLTGRPAGKYIFRARAAGPGGWWTDWSTPFDTTKPTTAQGLKIRKK